jgi:5-dehydro-2-deoxygluconokinase
VTMQEPLEVLTMGRIGVDIYPLQTGRSLRHVQTFGKYLGGSPTNVAVAAARYGRRAAVISRTGQDPFGDYIHDALRGFRVDDRFVTAVPSLPTPVTFCEIFPPDDFPLYFYRFPTAPDLQIERSELDLEAIAAAGIFWMTGTGLCQEPSRSATLRALEARSQSAGATVFDLDYRAMFWPSRDEARRWYREALPHATVAVGNLDECDTAVGVREPRAAAQALHDAGIQLAIIKQGPAGVLASDGTQIVQVPPVPVEVVNGLGAGDAFGGALCHALASGWDLERTLRFCNAAGAIVASRLACADAMPTANEVDAIMEMQATGSGAAQPRSLGPRGAARPSRPRDSTASAAIGARSAAGGSGGSSPRASTELRELVDTRVHRPQRIAEAAVSRRQATALGGEHGRLMIIAADHPARGALRAGEQPLAMANRADVLDRLCLALSRPGVNGVLGTPDILEDLLLLGALDDKVVIGSMNRGGLAGTSFEIDDRFTAYDAASIAASRFDGGKMLIRIDPDDAATARTLHACAAAVSDLAARQLIAMIEPFISRRVGGKVRNDLTPEAMTRAITVASGLGNTSAYTWLKVPYVDDMERVMAASTLPALILGGEVSPDQTSVMAAWRKTLQLPTVRGFVIGRSLLFPPDDNVAAAVDAVAEML